MHLLRDQPSLCFSDKITQAIHLGQCELGVCAFRRGFHTALFSGVLGVVQKFWITTGMLPSNVPYRFKKKKIVAQLRLGRAQYRETSHSNVKK
jgi:hypothetical protein